MSNQAQIRYRNSREGTPANTERNEADTSASITADG